MFPCDLVLLWTSTENHACHVTTANLDGETNLKVEIYFIRHRTGFHQIKLMHIKSVSSKLRKIQTGIPTQIDPKDLCSIRGAIVCDKPNTHLYDFNGKFITKNMIL